MNDETVARKGKSGRKGITKTDEVDKDIGEQEEGETKNLYEGEEMRVEMLFGNRKLKGKLWDLINLNDDSASLPKPPPPDKILFGKELCGNWFRQKVSSAEPKKSFSAIAKGLQDVSIEFFSLL